MSPTDGDAYTNKQTYLNMTLSLNISKKKKKFKNTNGNIVIYHKAFGHKKKLRKNFIKDFSFNSGVVLDYQYDPYKNSPSCLVFSYNKNFVYIPCIENLKIGSFIQFKTKKFLPGDYSSLLNIPVNTIISYIWDSRQKKFIYGKSAGSFCILISKTDKFALIKLKSGTLKILPLYFYCFFGKVSEWDFKKKKIIKKAGRNSWLGIRPTVRGVAMNPIDHPHGGGQGKTSGGRCSVSPWGKLTKGVPTVNTGLYNFLKNKLIRKYF